MALIASPRPTGPTPSPVFALKLICSTSVSSNPANRSRIAEANSASRGDSAKTITSRLTTSSPRRASSDLAASTKALLAAPLYCGSVSGNQPPMSPSAAEPSSASVTACSSTSASLWPTAPRSAGTWTPPIHSGCPGSSRWVSWPIPTRMLGPRRRTKTAEGVTAWRPRAIRRPDPTPAPARRGHDSGRLES